MRNRKNLLVLLLMLFVLIIWLIYTNINIETNKIDIESEKIPDVFDKFTIALVSDLHNYDWGNKLLDKIFDAKPDMIAITGDLIDSRTTDFDISLEFVRKAIKIAPIYYVTGNHEARIKDFPEFEKFLQNEGVILLDDTSQLLKIGNFGINLVGVKDPLFDRQNKTDAQVIDESLAKTLNKDYYNIVLSHRPEHFKIYTKNGADLVFTGHAHGGQVRIPFVGGLLAPNQGFFPKYTSGVYNEENTNMIVSRGLGNSVVPVRVNNMPELIIVELKSKN